VGTLFIQQVVAGLASGALYALLALAVVLVFRVSRVANFAQGEMAMISTFVAYLLMERTGMPLLLALFGDLLFAGVLGFILYFAIARSMSAGDPLNVTISTLGLQIALNAAALSVWGETQPFPFPAIVSVSPVRVGSFLISQLHLAIIAAVLLAALGLFLFFRYTMAGLAARAVALDRTVAALMGIPVERVIAQSWILGSVLGALAGAMFAPLTFLSSFMMQGFLLKAFSVAILGGMTSWPGVVVGGLLFGVVENVVSGYVSNVWQPAISYITIILVLLLRPAGLFSTLYRGRV